MASKSIFVFGLISTCFSATTVALFPKSSGVVMLDEQNFDHRVVKSDNVWIVEFFAPWCGHCKQSAPEYSKAAKALKGVVSLGAVNCDDESKLCSKYNVKGFPTIKIFAANKDSPHDYSGDRTAAGFTNEALAVTKRLVQKRLGGGKSGGDKSGGDSSSSGDVVELTEFNFKKNVINSDEIWLVEFFAPWCGHCQRLAPEWAKAATELKGKVKLGAVDATQHQGLAQEYGVNGYPTIKYFAAGQKVAGKSAVNYDGGRTASDIVEWALLKVRDNVPPPKLVEMTTQKVFESECVEKPLCVLSFLPHILDCQSQCRKDYLAMLQKAADKFKQQGWGWLWSEGGREERQALESAVDIGGFGYPALAVMNHGKMKFSVLTGSFSADGIHSFLRDLTYNRGRTSPVRGASIAKLADFEPWDGKDGEMPVDDEEDIDLSDVDLDDKDEL